MAALGVHVAEGLALGIDSGSDLVKSAAANMADAAAPAFGDLVPQLTPTSVPRTGATIALAPATIGVDPSANADPVIRALSAFIKLRVNGDVNAAFGTAG